MRGVTVSVFVSICTIFEIMLFFLLRFFDDRISAFEKMPICENGAKSTYKNAKNGAKVVL